MKKSYFFIFMYVTPGVFNKFIVFGGSGHRQSSSTTSPGSQQPLPHNSVAQSASSFGRSQFEAFLLDSQAYICWHCELLENDNSIGPKFCVSDWAYNTFSGCKRAGQGGYIFKKKGFNMSCVQGMLSTRECTSHDIAWLHRCGS